MWIDLYASLVEEEHRETIRSCHLANQHANTLEISSGQTSLCDASCLSFFRFYSWQMYVRFVIISRRVLYKRQLRYLSKRYQLADWSMIISLVSIIEELMKEIMKSIDRYQSQNSKRSWEPALSTKVNKPLTLFNKTLSTLLRGGPITITFDFLLSRNRINGNLIRGRACA